MRLDAELPEHPELPEHAELVQLRARWAQKPDGETGLAYGHALAARGLMDRAADVYTQLIANDYPVGYYELAWLEHDRGRHERAEALLQAYLDTTATPDEFADHVAGVLGYWRWHSPNRMDAEALLRRGAAHYPSARADLGHLLRARGDDQEAEAVLRAGVAARELDSYLPLANLLDETGRSDEAEQLYRDGFDLGDAFCAFNLSLLLERQGCDDEAAAWLRKAADGGDAAAARRLAGLD